MKVAAKIHQPEVFNFLLSIGIDTHLQDENQKSAATTVLTRRGSQEYALRIDEDDLVERLNWTPLHKRAALARDGDVVEAINEVLLELEHGKIDSRDSLGWTPLVWLAENGEADAIQLLNKSQSQYSWRTDVHRNCPSRCRQRWDVNAQDKHERTPLLYFSIPELLNLMLDRGADMYTKDDEGTIT
ncbi:Uveal autoantigen with coiled-coil domains and ankyrin repeats [Cytospora mali]|uniref:Uveal autoantigen with coiled-coil domains and ankyrin repeats n=1 Tax=Cytospora mali TaxID=578113 RepID=A0A194VIY8_CYTMA|nr:Uveal autoantigen with coiled-coil domains and ankyrin repeats [Valsa mali]